AAVGMMGMILTAYNLWQTSDSTQKAADAARLAAVAQVQYKEITRTFPAAPTTSDNLIKAVNIYQQVVKTVRSPQPFMQMVSRAMDPHPEIFLQEINWNYGTERPDAAGASPAPDSAKPPASISTTPSAEGLRQSGVLAGEIRPFQGDFRAAIASINRFAERLASDPAVADVKVIKLPLNVNPELTLSGDTRDAADHAGTAEFRILLTLKPNA
ncbi:MAG TPA: hypothetical protein VK642_06855, partial [Burkholderiales bacterium]|nr:hypothetical protein [Burkholderiales bacterium]